MNLPWCTQTRLDQEDEALFSHVQFISHNALDTEVMEVLQHTASGGFATQLAPLSPRSDRPRTAGYVTEAACTVAISVA